MQSRRYHPRISAPARSGLTRLSIDATTTVSLASHNLESRRAAPSRRSPVKNTVGGAFSAKENRRLNDNQDLGPLMTFFTSTRSDGASLTSAAAASATYTSNRALGNAPQSASRSAAHRPVGVRSTT